MKLTWRNTRKRDWEIHKQAGSRRGLRRAMLRTHAWLKLSRTDTQMDRWMDRHCATIRASLACASRAKNLLHILPKKQQLPKTVQFLNDVASWDSCDDNECFQQNICIHHQGSDTRVRTQKNRWFFGYTHLKTPKKTHFYFNVILVYTL